MVARIFEFRTSRARRYEKLEKQSLLPIWGRPGMLLVRHAVEQSEMSGLLCHVIATDVEHDMLPQSSLSRGREVVGQFCSQSHTNRKSAEWNLA